MECTKIFLMLVVFIAHTLVQMFVRELKMSLMNGTFDGKTQNLLQRMEIHQQSRYGCCSKTSLINVSFIRSSGLNQREFRDKLLSAKNHNDINLISIWYVIMYGIYFNYLSVIALKLNSLQILLVIKLCIVNK